jgi:DNA-3-methyladenine glycosylase II
LQARVDGRRITAASVAALSLDELRSVGLSPQKASYLHDLAARELDGRLNLRHIGRLDDEAVIEQLIRVKGVGRWTAQMFLIFGLGRLDVFPHDDLGVRAALQRLYGLDGLPDKAAGHALAEPWRPYATIGTWYCWRSGDVDRAERTSGSGYPV